jgi:hypothetical protein
MSHVELVGYNLMSVSACRSLKHSSKSAEAIMPPAKIGRSSKIEIPEEQTTPDCGSHISIKDTSRCAHSLAHSETYLADGVAALGIAPKESVGQGTGDATAITAHHSLQQHEVSLHGFTVLHNIQAISGNLLAGKNC